MQILLVSSSSGSEEEIEYFPWENFPRIIHWAIFLNIRTFVHRQDGHQRTIPLDASGAVLAAGASWREDQEDSAPPHAGIPMCNWLNKKTPQQWMVLPICLALIVQLSSHFAFFCWVFWRRKCIRLPHSIPQLKERTGALQEITVDMCQQIFSRNIANAGATWTFFVWMWKFPKWIKISLVL